MVFEIAPHHRNAMQRTSDTCAAINLRKASRAISQFYDRALEPSGLTSTQFTVLIAIAIHGPATITALADRLVMDRSTLGRDLDRLEDQGWVTTTPGLDRRSKELRLTPTGFEILMQAVPLRAKAHAHIVEHIGSERLQNLLETVALVVDAVRAG